MCGPARDDDQHGCTLKVCIANERDEVTCRMTNVCMTACWEDDTVSLRNRIC